MTLLAANRLAGKCKMFGIDNKQVKRILDRIDWITLCAKTILVELAARFKIELPPPPEEP